MFLIPGIFGCIWWFGIVILTVKIYSLKCVVDYVHFINVFSVVRGCLVNKRMLAKTFLIVL